MLQKCLPLPAPRRGSVQAGLSTALGAGGGSWIPLQVARGQGAWGAQSSVGILQPRWGAWGHPGDISEPPLGAKPKQMGLCPMNAAHLHQVSPCCVLHLSTAPSFSSPRAAAPLEMGIPNGIPKWDPTRAPARDGALTMHSSLKPALPLHQAKASQTTRWLREVQPEFILLLAKLLFSREPKEIAGLCPSPLFDAGFINSV